MTDLITIIGPTASGKTTFAATLANRVDGEIISGDSRQVYRSMDIGTGKDLKDYIVENNVIKHHLIDIREPGDKYTLYNFQEDFYKAYQDIKKRNKVPILCGGTGLYIESILKGYQLIDVPKNEQLRESLKNKSLDELSVILSQYKTLHNTTDLDTKQRAIRAIEIAHAQQHANNNDQSSHHKEYEPIDSIIIGLSIDREYRRKKISTRLKSRIEDGMVDEIKGLLSRGVSAEDLIYYGLEYKFVTLYAIGKLTHQEMLSQLEIAIHQFAKRQMTWFRGMERRGLKINWIDALLPMEEKIEKAMLLLSKK